MKKYYIPTVALFNNICANNKTNTVSDIAKTLNNTYRYTVVHDELKITQSLNDYKELESYKREVEESIKKANDEGSAELQKHYKRYQELTQSNASKAELEDCASKIQHQTTISENKIKLLQDEFQMKLTNKVENIRKTVKEAIANITKKIAEQIKNNRKSTDNIIVVSENRDNVLGLSDDVLESFDITDLVINYLEGQGKISNKKSTAKTIRNSKANNNKNNINNNKRR